MRTVVPVLTVLGFALPLGMYFWFIHHYAVNLIWFDQWDDINVISHSYSHPLALGTLWAQHNENRIFFPNLIVVFLAHTTDFNIVDEEYLSGLMLMVATGLFILAHQRRSPSKRWIYYCPVAILMFSFAQVGNALWGFQMAWYLVILALALTIFLLDRPRLTWLVLIGAIATAIVGSLSSLQGLLIWSVGLVILYLRRRRISLVLTWILFAIATSAVYFHNFNFAETASNNSFVFTHPMATLQFFFSSTGDFVWGSLSPVIVLGIVIFGLAIWVVIAYGTSRDSLGGSPIGVALVCFGLLFAVIATEGRAWLGPANRFVTFDLLILIGCYLALLDSPPVWTHARGGYHLRSWTIRPRLVTAMRTVLVSVVCVQVVLGINAGLADAKAWHRTELVAEDATVNIDGFPKSVVDGALLPGSGFLHSMTFVRRMAHIARIHHLSLFSTDAVALFSKEGLPPPVTKVIVPSNGARLSGITALDATATGTIGPSKVYFRLTAEGWQMVLGGIVSPIGFLARWNTTSVPNGVYTLQSVALNLADKASTSPKITVIVRN